MLFCPRLHRVLSILIHAGHAMCLTAYWRTERAYSHGLIRHIKLYGGNTSVMYIVSAYPVGMARTRGRPIPKSPASFVHWLWSRATVPEKE